MKTVLISGAQAMPAQLRDLVERGSTSVQTQRPGDLDEASVLSADRIVFWSSGADDGLRSAAERLARAEARDRREALVFVTTESNLERPASISDNEFFVWPRDEDRLRMAFLTGA
jgi:hypothetical protein